MCCRVALSLIAALTMTGCPGQTAKPKTQECQFVIVSEVDGVSVASPGAAVKTSQAGDRMVFSLPCGSQPFRFEKPCYPAQQVTLTSGRNTEYALTRNDWEHHGYFRLHNNSKASTVEVSAIPGSSLVVPSEEHSSRRLPLGSYQIQISAPFKETLSHELRLCRKDEISSLLVDTNGPDNDWRLEETETLTLDHGIGNLRIVTEVPNLVFRLQPERPQALQALLKKVGAEKLSDVDPETVPEGIRQVFTLLRRLDSRVFPAPNAIELPAGRYRLELSNQPKEAEPLVVEVLPDRETRVEL